jgi:SAM-dependent methyltransferase
MFSSEGWDPTGRFTGLAAGYAKHRPSYPREAIDCLIQQCRLHAGSTVADVGCGTGISTRLLAARGLHVIGVEPNADMMAAAQGTAPEDESGVIEYRDGQAENTGLPASCAAAVTAFQSFHWFDGERALAEFHRILAPGGCLALVWNDRDDTDPLTRAYHDILIGSLEGQAVTSSWRQSSEILNHSRWFALPRVFTFSSDQILDEEGLVGRALSASYAPREPANREKLVAGLRDLFKNAEQNGLVRMRYQVNLFVSQRADMN